MGTDRQHKANVSCTAEVPVTVLLEFQVWKMTTLQGTPQLSQVINSLSLCARQSNSARFNWAYALGPLGCKFQQSQEAEDQDSQLCPYSRVREQRIISCHCSFSFWKLIWGAQTIMLLHVNHCDLKFSHEETTRGNIEALILWTWIWELFNSSQWRGNIVLLIYSLKIMICIST